MKTTIGAILLNDVLPKELREYNAIFDKKTLNKKLTSLAQNYPNKYSEAVFKIKQLGDKIAFEQGASLSLSDLIAIKEKDKILEKAREVFKDAAKIKDDPIKLDYISNRITKLRGDMEKAIEQKTIKTNRLTQQVVSGARGNISQLNSMVGAPMLYSDHKDRVIPVLIERNFGEGLRPYEYWASAYGTRKGVIGGALGTAKAGGFSKEINRALDTLVVTTDDCDTSNGIYESIDSQHLVGRYLAEDYGKVERNILLTPEIVDTLRKNGHKIIKVRSPITCEAEKGICSYCRGITEYGRRPVIGENIGLVSAQTVTEPITQSSLSTKHTGGLAGRKTLASSVLDMSKQLLNVPKNFINETPLAPVDGKIAKINEASQGGWYLFIDGDEGEKEEIYIPPDLKIRVKVGDEVESGDELVFEENTLTNPSQLIKYKGLGEGRKYFIEKFGEWLKGIDKRHFEVIARGVLNKAIVTQDGAFDDFTPDDILDYSYVAKKWKPKNVNLQTPKEAVGKYLAKSVGQHLVGTRIRKSFLKDFDKYGIKGLYATKEPPSFEPFSIRMNDIPKVSLNWAKRLGATHLKRSILDAVRRNMFASEKSTEFQLPLAAGVGFGLNRTGGKY